MVIREDSRMRGSEERIEQTVAHVWQWVDRLIERQTIYRDPDEARADAPALGVSTNCCQLAGLRIPR